jgi:hypothetical protein
VVTSRREETKRKPKRNHLFKLSQTEVEKELQKMQGAAKRREREKKRKKEEDQEERKEGKKEGKKERRWFFFKVKDSANIQKKTKKNENS